MEDTTGEGQDTLRQREARRIQGLESKCEGRPWRALGAALRLSEQSSEWLLPGWEDAGGGARTQKSGRAQEDCRELYRESVYEV
jgi:hypothetical protein